MRLQPVAYSAAFFENQGNRQWRVNFQYQRVLYSKDTAPINVSEQAVYFWVTLPIVLFPLSLIPAHWYHRTMKIPLFYSTGVSLVSFFTPALVVVHIVASERRMFNAMISMGVGTCSSVLLVALASIVHGVHRSARGGYEAYRAACIIQKAWREKKSGIGLEKVQNWMAASGVDDHAVVLDEAFFQRLKTR